MIEVISGMPENVVAVAAHGKVSGEDYEKVLVPAVEKKLETHKKIRFFYYLGDDFTGYTAAAVWDDAKLGLRHLISFEKVAVVTDVPWIADMVKLFGFLVPCPVKLFTNQKISEAKTWVSE
jgi:hypothetical protein